MTKNITNLPRLELTENPDKKSDFIIFRNSMNKKTKKHVLKKKTRTRKTRTRKTRKTRTRKIKKNRKKGLFNLFL